MVAEAPRPADATDDRVLLAPVAGFAIILLSLSVPWRTGSATGTIYALFWSVAMAVLLFITLKRGSVLVALIPFLFGLAYAPLLGEHVSQGLMRAGMRVSPGNAFVGSCLMTGFVSVVVVSALWLERTLRAARPLAAFQRPPTTFESRMAHVAVLGVLGLTAVAAYRSGFWSYYGTSRVATATSGGVRLELHYAQLLFVMAALLLARDMNRRILLLAAIAVMVFVLQQRRMMVACAGLLLLSPWAAAGQDAPQTSGRRHQLLTTVVALALFVGLAASDTWRSLKQIDDPLGALGQTATRFGEGPRVDAAAIENRLSYAWIDGLSIEHGDRLGGLNLVDAAAGELAAATPGLIYPNKYEVPHISCETTFRRLGLAVDLPCTAITEGYLAFGAGGVLFLGLIWGSFIGFASFAARQQRPLPRIFGMCCFAPIIHIETCSFPMVQGLRVACLVSIVVAVVTSLAVGLRSRLMVQQEDHRPMSARRRAPTPFDPRAR